MTIEETKARIAELLAQSIPDVEKKADSFVDRAHMRATNPGSMITGRAHARAALADFILAASKATDETNFEKLSALEEELSEADKEERAAAEAVQKTLVEPNCKANALLNVKKEHDAAMALLADAKAAVAQEIIRLEILLRLLDTLYDSAVTSIATAKEYCCWF